MEKQTYVRYYLQKEIEKRSVAIPRYSLRQFAKFVGLSPAFLSQFLNGKRLLSKESMQKIGMALGLNPSEIKKFLDESDQDKSHQNIENELFESVADWRTYALLNLINTPGFEWNYVYIAKRLRIMQVQAKTLMEKLITNGMVAEVNGRAARQQPAIRLENTKSAVASRQLQKQFLERALFSLENEAFETREVSSITFSMNAQHLQYAVEEIRRFRRELSDNLENLSKEVPAQEVYNLTVQLVPLTYNGSV